MNGIRERVNTEINAIIWTKDKISSVIVEEKSTDLDSTFVQHSLNKYANMKDHITALLKLLVIEKKRQADVENSKILGHSYENNAFVSMKDIRCALNQERI